MPINVVIEDQGGRDIEVEVFDEPMEGNRFRFLRDLVRRLRQVPAGRVVRRVIVQYFVLRGTVEERIFTAGRRGLSRTVEEVIEAIRADAEFTVSGREEQTAILRRRLEALGITSSTDAAGNLFLEVPPMWLVDP